jgi:hypothetical protein
MLFIIEENFTFFYMALLSRSFSLAVSIFVHRIFVFGINDTIWMFCNSKLVYLPLFSVIQNFVYLVNTVCETILHVHIVYFSHVITSYMDFCKFLALP